MGFGFSEKNQNCQESLLSSDIGWWRATELRHRLVA
jgi:hypothetical protein